MIETGKVLEEGLDVADEKAAIEDEAAAENTNYDIAKIGEKVHDGESERREETCLPSILKKSSVGLFKFFG